MMQLQTIDRDPIHFNRRRESLITSQSGSRQFIYFVCEDVKGALLQDFVKRQKLSGGIVYVKTNFAADDVAEQLNRAGVTTEALHDNKSRRTREKSFVNFQHGLTNMLVTTESASSCIKHIEASIIINYNLPVSAETYIRRLDQHVSVSGRLPKILSLCNESERGTLNNIHRVLAEQIEVLQHSAFSSAACN